MVTFKKATKKQARARVGLVGPAGSGKTFTALRLAARLGTRIAVIDSERGSASKYAGEANPDGGVFEFDACDLATHSPTVYVETITAAEKAGYEVIIIDSLSHAWMGKEGALEQVDNASARNRNNSYVAWRDVTPMHNRLVDAMISSSAHVIATLRAKTEYVLEEDAKGKKVPRKIGMAPVQRDGLEYEFDVVCDLDIDNRLVVSKTRCSALRGKVIMTPGAEFGDAIKAWLSDGAPTTPPVLSDEEQAIVADWTTKINEASDEPGLLAVATLIQGMGLPKDSPVKLALSPAYVARQKALGCHPSQKRVNGVAPAAAAVEERQPGQEG